MRVRSEPSAFITNRSTFAGNCRGEVAPYAMRVPSGETAYRTLTLSTTKVDAGSVRVHGGQTSVAEVDLPTVTRPGRGRTCGQPGQSRAVRVHYIYSSTGTIARLEDDLRARRSH